jgi:hypothetical protein
LVSAGIGSIEELKAKPTSKEEGTTRNTCRRVKKLDVMVSRPLTGGFTLR